MEDYNVVDEYRTPVIPVAAKKVHQFYFVKLYQDDDLNEGFEEAMILRQREFDDQIRETKRALDKILFRKSHLSLNGIPNTQQRIEWRVSYYYRNKSSMENELRSLRETLKRMSISSSKNPKYVNDTAGREAEENKFNLRKSHYRTLHHGANNLVEEKEMIKAFKQELEEKRIAEEERIAAQKKDDYHYRGYYKPKPEPSYSVKELKAEIKLKGMEIDRLRAYDRKERAEIRSRVSNMENMESDLVSLEKQMIHLKEQKAELDAVFFLMQRHHEEMKCARKLAEGKNVHGVKELSRALVDKFMSEWNDNTVFRKNYVRRNLASILERRQLTKDGFSKTSTRYFYAEKHNQHNI